jgi:predicted site-specific integrase-resolvase
MTFNRNDYTTVRGAADLFGVTQNTIHNWIKAGRITVVHLSPRRTLVPVAEIKRLEREIMGEYEDKLAGGAR